MKKLKQTLIAVSMGAAAVAAYGQKNYTEAEYLALEKQLNDTIALLSIEQGYASANATALTSKEMAYNLLDKALNDTTAYALNNATTLNDKILALDAMGIELNKTIDDLNSYKKYALANETNSIGNATELNDKIVELQKVRDELNLTRIDLTAHQRYASANFTELNKYVAADKSKAADANKFVSQNVKAATFSKVAPGKYTYVVAEKGKDVLSFVLEYVKGNHWNYSVLDASSKEIVNPISIKAGECQKFDYENKTFMFNLVTDVNSVSVTREILDGKKAIEMSFVSYDSSVTLSETEICELVKSAKIKPASVSAPKPITKEQQAKNFVKKFF